VRPFVGNTGWYAVYVKTRYEKLTAKLLEHKGYEYFLPMYRVRRRWSDRIKEVDYPLFPGYLFCRLDPKRMLPVLSTAGVVQVVGAGSAPVPIEPAEMDAVQRLVACGTALGPWPYVTVGELVTVHRGPLAGVEGIVVAEKKMLRLVVSITLLQRSVVVEVDRQDVSPLRPHALAAAAS
jgi:transcription antitermination factor NusG